VALGAIGKFSMESAGGRLSRRPQKAAAAGVSELAEFILAELMEDGSSRPGQAMMQGIAAQHTVDQDRKIDDSPAVRCGDWEFPTWSAGVRCSTPPFSDGSAGQSPPIHGNPPDQGWDER
jgi:hypothetical protein